MRELTDKELDSIGGGHHHHHHHHDSWTGGGSSGGGLTGLLGTTIIFINIGNTVGAEIGQQVNGLFSLNGAGVMLGSLGLHKETSARSAPPKKLHGGRDADVSEAPGRSDLRTTRQIGGARSRCNRRHACRWEP